VQAQVASFFTSDGVRSTSSSNTRLMQAPMMESEFGDQILMRDSFDWSDTGAKDAILRHVIVSNILLPIHCCCGVCRVVPLSRHK
jgi:hypothetical protein